MYGECAFEAHLLDGESMRDEAYAFIATYGCAMMHAITFGRMLVNPSSRFPKHRESHDWENWGTPPPPTLPPNPWSLNAPQQAHPEVPHASPLMPCMIRQRRPPHLLINGAHMQQPCIMDAMCVHHGGEVDWGKPRSTLLERRS